MFQRIYETLRRHHEEGPNELQKHNTASNQAGGEAIPPFSLCLDVELGPLLPPVPESKIKETWEKVKKNKCSSDATKTEKQSRHSRDPPGNEARKTRTAVVEVISELNHRGTGGDATHVVSTDLSSINQLARAVHMSFYKHYPLRLSSDVIWLTILQGLAKHIDKDPERQRKNLVNFEGKKLLVVSRPRFVKGSSKNDWTTVFGEFADLVENYIGKDKAPAMTSDFSTSTSTKRICSNIALMDTVKHYFEYATMCGCGIPSIEFTGTVADSFQGGSPQPVR